ncbi:MAG: hypothetical protein IH908_01895 [Proteobacteria bacterium]|nr:hypothetical protein [Pseudomonadota bacterium]
MTVIPVSSGVTTPARPARNNAALAGSGTTAHAVLDLNKQDGGNRKFLLVQLPEPTGRTDYLTIADICIAHAIHLANSLDIKEVHTPNIAAYWERMIQRPAYQRAAEL